MRLYETPRISSPPPADTSPDAPAPSTTVPDPLPDYVPHGVIGQGVMGTIFEVACEGRRFALKSQGFIDGNVPATTLAECMAATQCEHPCINPVVDILFTGEESTAPPTTPPAVPTRAQLVMRLAADGHLGAYMGLQRLMPSQRSWTAAPSARLATLPFAERRQFAFDIVSALAFLHAHSVIHGDLSPHNVVVHRGRARLIDFGLALRDVGQPKGGDVQSLCFRAPEVFLQGVWGTAVDMWSFGCLLRWVLFADVEDYLFDTAPYQADAAGFFQQLLRHRRHAASWPATAAERAQYRLLTGGHDYSGRVDDGDFPATWRPRYGLSHDQEKALRVLVQGCLRMDARRRLTAADALRSPLFDGLTPLTGTWHGTLPALPVIPACDQLQLLRQHAHALQLTDTTLLLAVDLYSRAPDYGRDYLFASLYIAAALSAHAYPMIGERWGVAAALHAIIMYHQREREQEAAGAALTSAVTQLAAALGYRLYPDNLFTTLGENAVTRAIMHAFIDGRLGRMATRFWQQRRFHELLGMAEE